MSFNLPRLLIISNGQQTRAPVLEVLKDLCAAGAPWLLLREDTLPLGQQRDLAVQLMPHIGQAKISISDDVEFALHIGAHGIHVVADVDLNDVRAAAPNLIMGVHCHNITEVARAQEAGADYVTLSPIFATASKPGYGPALGLDTLRQTAQAHSIPILALAGITTETVVGCLNAGAHGVAIMGDIMRADDPVKRMQAYTKAFGP